MMQCRLMNHVMLLWHTAVVVICEPLQIPGWIGDEESDAL